MIKKPPLNKCKNHPSIDAVSNCHVCKRQFCTDCLLSGPQYFYCKSEHCKLKYLEAIDYFENPRFCPECIAETIDESSGNLTSINYLAGDRFHIESAQQCPTCGSVIVRKTGSFFRKKEEYRIIWLDENRTKFNSRRLK